MSSFSDATIGRDSPPTPDDGEGKRNLIVNYLPPSIDEETLKSVFAAYGSIRELKVVRDRQNHTPLSYGFVKYHEASAAASAIVGVNGFCLDGKKLKVSYSRPPSAYTKNCKIYITNLPRTYESERVKAMFAGEVIECRVLQNKGVAFIQFATRADADAALNLNGQVIPGSTRKLMVQYSKQQQQQQEGSGGAEIISSTDAAAIAATNSCADSDKNKVTAVASDTTSAVAGGGGGGATAGELSSKVAATAVAARHKELESVKKKPRSPRSPRVQQQQSQKLCVEDTPTLKGKRVVAKQSAKDGDTRKKGGTPPYAPSSSSAAVAPAVVDTAHNTRGRTNTWPPAAAAAAAAAPAPATTGDDEMGAIPMVYVGSNHYSHMNHYHHHHQPPQMVSYVVPTTTMMPMTMADCTYPHPQQQQQASIPSLVPHTSSVEFPDGAMVAGGQNSGSDGNNSNSNELVPGSCFVAVYNFPMTMGITDLYSLFAPYTGIRDIKIESFDHGSYIAIRGIVIMSSRSHAELAVSDLNGWVGLYGPYPLIVSILDT